MRQRDKNIALEHGFTDRIMDIERDLLNISGILPDESEQGIGFDLTSWSSGIRYIIIVPKYYIDVTRKDYFEERKRIVREVLETAEKYGLKRTGDRIEDYGAHYYIVLRCDDSWPVAS